MPFPIINKIMKINKNTLWIRDIEDFINELYFQSVISQSDKDYILDLILKNTRDNNEMLEDLIFDMICVKEGLDDAINKAKDMVMKNDA